MKPNIFKLFPTTVMEFDLRGYPNKEYLLNYIQNFNTIKHGLISKGNSSYGKNSILFQPKYKSLANKIQECVNEYAQYIGLSQPVQINASWFNIMLNKGKTKLHNHGITPISGAYYPLLEENTCNLIFKSPLYSALVYSDIPNNTNFQNSYQMSIKQDYLYLFPGFLEHETQINKGKKRIVISFNTSF